MCIAPRWFVLVALVTIATATAAERRAPPPKFSANSFRGVFFADPSQAFRGTRPMLGSAIESTAPAAGKVASLGSGVAAPTAVSGFTAIISPATLEDEIKRLRLQLEAGISTPAAFQSGGFQDARRDLTILASLFGVIGEHAGDVRWKKDAPAARDLIARTAVNCKSGSAQVYNEVKQRKVDLEDLVSGAGMSNRQAEPENDWGAIADRVPLMTYIESLLEGPLKAGTRDADAVKAEGERVRRAAELVAMVGEILTKDGLADADDSEYSALCRQMTAGGAAITLALDQGDAGAASKAVGALSQTCAKCHEGYR